MTGTSRLPAISPVQALGALTEVVDAVQEYLNTREQERTKRVVLASARDAELKRIRSAEKILTRYFDHVFAERSKNFSELLRRLDQATEQGDPQRATETLSAIVAIAQQSPLADVGDLSKVRAALENPDHEWRL